MGFPYFTRKRDFKSLHVPMCLVCTPHACLMPAEANRALDPLALERVLSHHVGAGFLNAGPLVEQLLTYLPSLPKERLLMA